MTARDKLAAAFKAAVIEAGPRHDDLEQLGPPTFAFRAYGLPNVRFEGRPISTPPKDNWVGIIYRPTAEGGYRQAGVGMFKDGRWLNANRRSIDGDIYWTAIVDG